MTALDVLLKITAHFSKASHTMCQLANMGDFLNYRALKRMGEFYGLKCMYDKRMIDRYIIGVCNAMPKYMNVEMVDIIPAPFYNAKRIDVTVEERKKYSEFIMQTIMAWLLETKKILEQSYTQLTSLGEIDIACRIKGLIECFSYELKYFERKWIECQNVQYMPHHMERIQDKWHDEYKEKTDALCIEEL